MSHNSNHSPTFRTAYGPSLRTVVIDAGPTEESPGAVQEFRDECDINNIMLDVGKLGYTDWLNARQGSYEDVTDVDFRSAMDTVLRAQEAFDALPSEVRDRFANSPERFLAACHDPAMADELVRLGLREPPVPPVPPSPPPAKE